VANQIQIEIIIEIDIEKPKRCENPKRTTTEQALFMKLVVVAVRG